MSQSTWRTADGRSGSHSPHQAARAAVAEQRGKLGMIGRKVGMMRIFTEEGDSIPVTVLDMSTNRITQVKTTATDGYNAVQVASGSRRAHRVTKAMAGHFAKAGVLAGNNMHEFRLGADHMADLAAGGELKVDQFVEGQFIDVSGTSHGKGFTGTIKRHNFSSQRASHGNSRSHNVPGSIGMAQDPGRVFPGKRMSGQMGNVSKTVQNLKIARIDNERQLLMVRGAVPGAKNGKIIVMPARKKPAPADKG